MSGAAAPVPPVHDDGGPSPLRGRAAVVSGRAQAGTACVETRPSAAVAFAGIIAFVGLIVPHTLRLVVVPSHRYLAPLSALGGAVLLGVADIAARTVIPFGDLLVGIFTALVGGPLFLVLLRRTLKRSGATA